VRLFSEGVLADAETSRRKTTAFLSLPSGAARRTDHVNGDLPGRDRMS
jgi:hypothetical protein